MVKSLLHHLFGGDICPSEIIGIYNTELEKINRMLGDEKPNLLEKLSSDDRESLERIDNLIDNAHGIYSIECFEYGFKFGALLMIEILNGRSELLRK